MIEYYPFCSQNTEVCNYIPAGIILSVLFTVVIIFVIKLAVKSFLSDSYYLESVSTTEAPMPKVLRQDRAEKWLSENNLMDDSYSSIIYDYCGLGENRVPIKMVDISLKDEKFTISLSFPNTIVTRLISFDINTVTFKTDESIPLGSILADISLNDYFEDLSPEYDSEIETPLDGVDWDSVSENLLIEIHMCQATFDKIFPEKA